MDINERNKIIKQAKRNGFSNKEICEMLSLSYFIVKTVVRARTIINKEKACTGCRVLKPIGDFIRHKYKPDGHLNLCKVCYHQRNRDDRNKLRAKKRKLYPELVRAKDRIASKKAQKKNIVQHKCRLQFRNAIRNGTLIKPNTCSECSSCGQIDGHHKDYSKPFDVIWLCTECHGKTRRIYI